MSFISLPVKRLKSLVDNDDDGGDGSHIIHMKLCPFDIFDKKLLNADIRPRKKFKIFHSFFSSAHTDHYVE